MPQNFISYKDLIEINDRNKKYMINPLDEYSSSLFAEAEKNNQCSILLDSYVYPQYVKDLATILVKIEPSENIPNDVLGYMIYPLKDHVDTCIAVDYANGWMIKEGPRIAQLSKTHTLDELIEACDLLITDCPLCHTHVLLKDQYQYSSWGRCCPKCYPEARDRHLLYRDDSCLKTDRPKGYPYHW